MTPETNNTDLENQEAEKKLREAYKAFIKASMARVREGSVSPSIGLFNSESGFCQSVLLNSDDRKYQISIEDSDVSVTGDGQVDSFGDLEAGLNGFIEVADLIGNMYGEPGKSYLERLVTFSLPRQPELVDQLPFRFLIFHDNHTSARVESFDINRYTQEVKTSKSN